MFKVGDSVRVVKTAKVDGGKWCGKEGVVIETERDSVYPIRAEIDNTPLLFVASELELVEDNSTYRTFIVHSKDIANLVDVTNKHDGVELLNVMWIGDTDFEVELAVDPDVFVKSVIGGI